MATILTSPDGPLVTVVTVRKETPDLDGMPVTVVSVHRLQSCCLVRLQRLLTLVQVVPDVRAGPFETGNREGRNRQNTPIGPIAGPSPPPDRQGAASLPAFTQAQRRILLPNLPRRDSGGRERATPQARYSSESRYCP